MATKKKAELVAEAKAEGVEVDENATKAEIVEALAAAEPLPGTPVVTLTDEDYLELGAPIDDSVPQGVDPAAESQAEAVEVARGPLEATPS